MKKLLYLMTAVITVAFYACTDDKKDSINLVVNNGVTEVSIDRIGGEITVPVTTTGSWEATLADNSSKWATVWTGQGKGDGNAVIYVSHLDPRTQLNQRTTTLTIKAGNNTQTISVRQFIGLQDGETAENEGEIYADLWNSKGIGHGINPLTGQLSQDAFLNVYGLNKLIRTDPAKWGAFYTQTPGPGVDGLVTLTDTLEDNEKGIHASAGIDITYATVKFHLDADYNNFGKQYRKAVRYIGSYHTTFLTGSIGYGNIASIISKDKSLDSIASKMLLEPIAQDLYLEILDAFNNKDDEEFRYQVERMCDVIGPVIVTKAELGGDCVIQLVFDELSMEDNFKIGGEIKGAVKAGIFELKATANAEYSKIGQDIWKNSKRSIKVLGGSPEALSKMLSALDAGTDDMEVVRANIREATVEWVKSINSYDDPMIAKQAKINGKGDNTALIKVEYSPIWRLFPTKCQREIKKIVVDIYKGKKLITVDPQLLGIVDENGTVSE